MVTIEKIQLVGGPADGLEIEVGAEMMRIVIPVLLGKALCARKAIYARRVGTNRFEHKGYQR